MATQESFSELDDLDVEIRLSETIVLGKPRSPHVEEAQLFLGQIGAPQDFHGETISN